MPSPIPTWHFECLIYHGEFQRTIEDSRLTGLIRRLSAKAAAESPEALKQLWARIPAAGKSVGTIYGFNLDLPGDADFPAYLDALREIQAEGRMPMNLSGVMEQWAKQDRGAATDYLLSRGESVPIHGEWNDIHWMIKTADGKPAADRWMIETLREVPENQRSVFLKNINFVRATDPILALDPELFEPGEWNGYAANLLEAQIEGEMDCRELLGKVPAAEWIPALENVRGLRSSSAVEEYLRSGGIAEDEVKRISELVRQPKEPVPER